MRTAPEINVQDVPQPSAVRTWILRRVRKLAARHPDITKLRVAVDTPHRSQSKGRQFRVQIDVGLPGSDLVARNHPSAGNEHPFHALNDAFQRSERQLDDLRAIRQCKDRRLTRRSTRPTGARPLPP